MSLTIDEIVAEYKKVGSELAMACALGSEQDAWAAMQHLAVIQANNDHQHASWVQGKHYRVTTIASPPDPGLQEPGWAGLRAHARMFSDPQVYTIEAEYLGWQPGNPAGQAMMGRLLVFRILEPTDPTKELVVMAESDPLAIEELGE